MKLRRIELPGFGCLRDFHAELAPGLNLFFGLNEAGKSTLQQAVCALLYGFYGHDRARPDEAARHERFRPWPSGSVYAPPFRGALQYELEDGRTYEVRRDFSTTDLSTQVIDLTTGADIAPTFGRSRHGNVPFARKHLGMSSGVFQSCAFISQGEIFRVTEAASPQEIGDAIAALADSGRRDVSAARAVAALDTYLSRLGSDRARTAELPRARESLRAAETELQALDAARTTLAEKCERLDQLRASLDKLQQDGPRAEYLLNAAQAAHLERRLEQVREAASALEHARVQQQALHEFAGIPANLRDEVLMLRDRRERALESLSRLKREAEDAAARTSPDDALELEASRTTVGFLTDDQIAALEAAAYQMADGGIVAAIVAVLKALARAVGRLISRLFRRAPALAPDAQPAPVRMSPLEAQGLLERHRRFLALRPEVERLQALEQRRQSELRALAGLEADLTALLAGAGISVEARFEDSVAAFMEVWGKRQEYLAAVAAAEEAESRHAALLGGRAPEELRIRLAKHVGRQAELAAAQPSLPDVRSDATADQLARVLEDIETDRHKLELAAGTLGEEVRLALERHRPRAEIEEDIERWHRRAESLERDRAAGQLAKTAIEEAMVSVYRDFVPAVNAFLSEGIEAVTEGRYRRAHVDPANLQISLLLPETDRVISNPPVSHGTWTLAYFLMRIGLAQHMSAIGEPVPLVLDDPFVDVDSERLPRILDFLLRLSERMQVLIFTKDEAVLRWFEREASGASHAFHGLSGRKIAAPAL